ncbi:hypothetical protein BX600DRAFT_555916 [Xylariales sp. PMI_506]|nr:hypothetical protein BX600DRAFT_555916 [Xylariales sp. PMI_506]
MPAASTSLSFFDTQREAVDDTPHRHLRTAFTVKMQRRWRSVKEWYTSSYPTCNTDKYEPSWVLAQRTNLANCRFYRLPDELILQILDGLDYVSKAIILRTCKLFMRIIFDLLLFSQTRGFYPQTAIQVWPPFHRTTSGTPLEAAGLKMLSLPKQVEHLLDRDRFCEPCRQFRDDGKYKKVTKALQRTLWCSNCHKTHKRPLFSPHQRETSSATRLCVLVEGTAPFCAHLSISGILFRISCAARKSVGENSVHTLITILLGTFAGRA